MKNHFTEIRKWAVTRGLYESGDPKTQSIKLYEEIGELSRAILKYDFDEIKDGIGDAVVVLTNLAHMTGFTIEECIEHAFNEIKDRKGSMVNNTFVKANKKPKPLRVLVKTSSGRHVPTNIFKYPDSTSALFNYIKAVFEKDKKDKTKSIGFTAEFKGLIYCKPLFMKNRVSFGKDFLHKNYWVVLKNGDAIYRINYDELFFNYLKFQKRGDIFSTVHYPQNLYSLDPNLDGRVPFYTKYVWLDKYRVI